VLVCHSLPRYAAMPRAQPYLVYPNLDRHIDRHVYADQLIVSCLLCVSGTRLSLPALSCLLCVSGTCLSLPALQSMDTLKVNIDPENNRYALPPDEPAADEQKRCLVSPSLPPSLSPPPLFLSPSFPPLLSLPPSLSVQRQRLSSLSSTRAHIQCNGLEQRWRHSRANAHGRKLLAS